MVYQERNTIVSIAVGLIVNLYVIAQIVHLNASGAFDGPDAVTVWARTVVWVIPISIVAIIVGTILFNIGHAIVTGNEKPSFLVDERDRVFEQRGMNAVVIFVAIGFIGTILGLAIGWSALIGFNIIYFSMALGSLAADVVKFISYRRGF